MRGYGDSAKQGRKDLSAKTFPDADPNLYRAMWKDVAAAYAFLVERGADPGRIAILGERHAAAVALDDAVRQREPQPGPHAHGLGGEERVEDPAPDLLRDAGSVVTELEPHSLGHGSRADADDALGPEGIAQNLDTLIAD